MKKVLGIFLVLAMLLSFAPALEVAAAETTTWTKVDSLADISTTDTFAITITVGGNTYALPVMQSGNASGSTAIEEVPCTVDGNKLTITNTTYSFGWNLVPTTGGYHIKSGDLYLYVTKSNNGIRIYEKDPTTDYFVWNVLNCGLLGAIDEDGNYRTLCVDSTLDPIQWVSYKTTGGAVDGTAYSTVRDNVLGLWKLNVAHTCTDAAGDGDHLCDTCNQPDPNSTCSDATGDNDHLCDECNQPDPNSTCSDAAGDNDHLCDECNQPDPNSTCADTDDDKFCDECNAALCGEDHLDLAGDGDHKCDRCPVDNVTDCSDAAGDGDHKCDECDEPDPNSTCSDADDDGDHKCDECGKEDMNPCVDSDTDKDHKCDTCGKENMNECVDSDTDKDHDCDTCGKKDVTEHDWADATTAKPKTCKVCGKTEGDPLPTYHWVKVNSLSDISENDTFAITITVGGKTYVLPVVQSGKAAESTAIPEIPGTVKGNRLIFTDTSYSYGWNLVPTQGGYHIKSGDKYLYVSASNNGILIYKKNPTTDAFVWNVLDCGLLGAVDKNGEWRTLCIDETVDPYQWVTYRTSDYAADGKANTKARGNTLGLWKRVVGSPDDYASNTGDPITLTAAVMLVSGMSVVALIPKKKD